MSTLYSISTIYLPSTNMVIKVNSKFYIKEKLLLLNRIELLFKAKLNKRIAKRKLDFKDENIVLNKYELLVGHYLGY